MLTRVPVILDTDPGIGSPGSDVDDGLAIVLALRHPACELLGLTIVAGCPTRFASWRSRADRTSRWSPAPPGPCSGTRRRSGTRWKRAGRRR